MAMFYTDVTQVPFKRDELATMPVPRNVLMVEPTYFDVTYVINPHMEGHIGKIDKLKAIAEWEQLKGHLLSIGLHVHVLPGEPGLPDMVFCANQSLPCISAENKQHVLMSIMHAEQRKAEVSFVEAFYRGQGYQIHHLDVKQVPDFEGMGDAIWHPGRRLLWGGYGYRSHPEAYKTISDLYDVPVLGLELVNPAFYHLDTCLCMLTENSALYYPKAFTQQGLALLHSIFDDLIEVNEKEAVEGFACNALCPDGIHVILQSGLAETKAALQAKGFKVIETPTDEFLKSGGSVFCMKMMFW
jgi:N-dimethylarginine dimethylaminohydrolase